jgi:hypothetical protein
MKMRSGWFALCISACVLGCGDDSVKAPVETAETPLGLEEALLYVQSGTEEKPRALIVEVTRGDIAETPLPEGKTHAYARPAHAGEAVLLSEGAAARLKDGRGRDAVPSHVLIFDRGGELKRFELTARYSALALSDDGRFAIAYGPSGSWATADNIAIVDLERDPDGPIASTTVRALDGQGPSAIAFAPANGTRRLAVLVMTDAINLVDLDRPDQRDKVLPLKLPNGSASLKAKQVLFAGDHYFVQPDRGSDILAVRLEDDASPIGFHAALSTLGTESTLRDVALLDGSAAPRLIALGESSLRVIDTLNGSGESSPAQGGFTAVHVFEGASPFDETPRTRALLYAQGNNRLGFVDLQRELPGNERSVDQLTLSAGLDSIAFPEGEPLAVIAQKDGRVSLVNLQDRTVSSLGAGANITQLLLDQRPGLSRVWVVTASGSLGAIDLARRTPRELLLDRAATFVVPVLGATPRVAVGQSASSGSVLLLDANDPSRASAREIAGFLYNGFLD